MRVPLVGGHYKGRSLNLNAQETINFYPILDQESGKYESALVGCPGTAVFCNLSLDVEIRGLHVMGSYLYAIGGSTLYKIDTTGTETAQTGTLSTSSGMVYMADDGTNLMIVDPGVEGYVYTVASGTMTAIADADFPTPSSLTWQDGYFIISKDAADEFYISDTYTPTSWVATEYAAAEGKPDILQRVFMDHLQLWLIGKETTEVWYNSGNATFPFERISGAFIQHGTSAPASVAAGDNAVFWLNQDNQVLRADGFSPRIISTRQLEYQFSQYSSVTDAKGFCYVQDGHTFYVLIFPTGNETWAYDCATTLWHQRQSWPILSDGNQGRHRANCYAFFNNKHLIGDYRNGKIYEWKLDTYDDDDGAQAIRASRVWQVIHQDRKNLFFNQLEVEVEAGIGLYTGQGSDPQIMLSWSDDGGHTWSNEHWLGMGAIGEYKKRAVWRRLGRSRNRNFKISISDPIKKYILTAHLEAELGAS